jgi:glycerol dehydrogenase
VQGPGVLDRVGHYLTVLPSRQPAVLVSAGGKKRFGARLAESLTHAGAKPYFALFGGECSYEEAERLEALIRNEAPEADALVCVGGGKCLDAGKSAAFRLGLPVVICPTIASTDAPCSAVSVMYTANGVQIGPEFYPSNPALVVVDSQIIIEAPARQLVAGMGDGLATYYEARTCFENPEARSNLGARLTITALAISELCAKTIYAHGLKALEAMRSKRIDESFEQVVEANTLLSGVGFESGGLAAAHALAGGLTAIPILHEKYYHGELVGIGLLSHLLLEGKPQEAEQVAQFLVRIGLPVHAGQLSIDFEKDADGLRTAMKEAVAMPLMASEPFAVTPEHLLEVFRHANALGVRTAKSVGDQAYRMLHPS